MGNTTNNLITIIMTINLTKNTITIDSALATIKSGKFCNVTFAKRDGSIRNLNGRCGVTFAVTGKGMKYKPEDKNIIIIRDVQKKEYRAVRIESILAVNGKTVIR